MSMATKKPAKKPSRGRPRGSKNEVSKRTKSSCNLSLDLDVIAWLEGFKPEKSSAANRVLRAAMLSGLEIDVIASRLTSDDQKNSSN